MAGKDRILDMGSSSDTEDNYDDMRRHRSYRRLRHYPSSPKPASHSSTPFGGARAKDGSAGAGLSWTTCQHRSHVVPLPGQPDKITLVVDDTRFVMEPGLFTQHPDTMLGGLADFLAVVQCDQENVAVGPSVDSLRQLLSQYN